jgi:type I site-specific restriction endonuclease
VNVDTQPVALALIEAKNENLPPGHGLDQAKGYAECRRHNVQFIFTSNGQSIAEVLRVQMASVGNARAPLQEELATINALPAALLRRAFSGEL